MAEQHIALQYMTGFRCIGPACEDHCCGGWTVLIDQVHHDKLRALMTERGEAARFEAAISPPPRTPSKQQFAVINQRADGNCAFLATDRSCEIHGSYGEEYLSDGCATYPRRVSRVGERAEVNASVSCPEVARRLLLEDRACEIVTCEPGLLGRGGITQHLVDDPSNPYTMYFDPIRDAMFELLGRREYPMRSRLFFLTMLGERLSSYLVRGTPLIDPQQLAGDLHIFGQPETLARLDAGLRGAEASNLRAVNLVVKLLSERLSQGGSPRFRTIFLEWLKGLASAGAGVTIDGDDLHSAVLSVVEVAAHLDTERDTREALVGPRLELYLENYCRNWVFRDWYVYAPSLSVHVQRLLIRVAIARILLLGQPALAAAAAAGPDAVDRLAVGVFYTLARTLEHSTEAVNLTIAEEVGEAPPLTVALELLRI